MYFEAIDRRQGAEKLWPLHHDCTFMVGILESEFVDFFLVG